MGVATAPLITGMLLTYGDWRLCFTLPGVFCLAYGVVFALALKEGDDAVAAKKTKPSDAFAPKWRRALSGTSAIDGQRRIYLWCHDIRGATLF